MSYRDTSVMILAAEPYPGLIRLMLGVVTIAVVTVLWMIGLFGGYAAIWQMPLLEAAAELMELGTPRPEITAMYLFLIGGMGLGTIIAARIWQKRTAGSLFGPRVATLRHFGVAAGLSLAVMLALGLLTLPFIDLPEPNLDPSRWLLWLPIAVLALAVQTGSEELVFRGYLQSQLAARFRSPVIWLLLPALIFAAIHLQPGLNGPHMMTILTVAFLFGVLSADLTARTGNIGAAWGFHFANNALIILFVSNDSALGGLSLFRVDSTLADLTTFSPLILLEFVTLIAIWALIRRVLQV
jgi:membrane protease YdiL (CAAX protease family)